MTVTWWQDWYARVRGGDDPTLALGRSGARPQGAHLRADGRDRRGADLLAARGDPG